MTNYKEDWSMIKDGLLNHYKQLFLNTHGPQANLPPDDFLIVAARIAAHLREKGELVSEMVNGNLYIESEPSCVGLAVHPKGLLRIWFNPETFKYREQRHIWDGEWSRWIGEILEYTGEIHFGPDDIILFNPEKLTEKLLRISAKFMGLFSKIKVVLDRLEADREKLYADAKVELEKILNQD